MGRLVDKIILKLECYFAAKRRRLQCERIRAYVDYEEVRRG